MDLGGYYNETTGTWTVSAGDEWTPIINDFTGILDGLGHTISGIYINNPEESNQGLFRTLEGMVKNLRIINGYINGKSNIGVIAGTNNGTIENCYDNAIILAISSDNGKVKVDGIWYASVDDYVNGQPILITFTIDSVTYYAPDGIDWKKWCLLEKYNTAGIKYLEEDGSLVNDLNNPLLKEDGVKVKGSDLIDEGNTYIWTVGEQTDNTE